MRLRRKVFITIATISLLYWFVPPVYLLKFGTLTYEAYEPDGIGRYYRQVGPLAKIFSSPSTNATAEWTPDGEINRECRAALVAAEDIRFNSHLGIDFKMIRMAAERDWRMKQIAWGGSSITQQIVKNLFLGREKTVFRKVREAIGALLLDRILSKQSQLTWYFNSAEFGPRLYGIGPAARHYFNKSPKALSLSECVALVSVLPDPIKSYQSIGRGDINSDLEQRQRATLNILSSTKNLPREMIDEAASNLRVSARFRL